MLNKGEISKGAIIGVLQLVFTLCLFCLALVYGRFSFQADILSILPSQQYSPAITQAEEQLFKQLQESMMFTVSGEQSEQAYQALESELKQLSGVKLEPYDLGLKDVSEFYLSYNSVLLPSNLKSALASKESFDPYYFAKLNQVANPFVSDTIEQDPSLILAEYIEQTVAQFNHLDISNGRIKASDGQSDYFMLFATSSNAGANIKTSQIIAQQITQLIADVKAQFPNAEIRYSGVLFHTAENSAQAEFEISVFGSLSLVAVITIVIAVFRSPVPLIWISLTIANALLTGFTLLLWSFEQVHLLSLVFGISLVGIAIDYCFHILCSNKKHSRNSVLATIIVGFITTSLGYFIFVFSPVAMLAQVAVFVIGGLVGAVAISVLARDYCHYRVVEFSNKTQWFVNKLTKTRARHKWVLTGLSAFTLIYYVVTEVKFDDNIALLNASSSELVSNEAKHGQLLGTFNTQYLYVEANSLEDLLQREEALIKTMAEQFPQADLTTVSQWVPSMESQGLNYQLLKQAEQRGSFASVSQLFPSFSIKPANFITEQQLDSPLLSSITEGRLVKLEDTWVSVMDVKGVPFEQLQRSSFPKYIQLYNKQQSLTQAITYFRQNMMVWIASAAAIAIFILAIKCGAIASVYSAMSIFICLGLTLAVSQLIQGYLNIFNLLSAVLIIALAVDYLLFYHVRKYNPSNLLAINLSAVSSLLVFGILVVSKTPAVFSFGLSVSFGIVFIYLLAPLSVRDDNEERTM